MNIGFGEGAFELGDAGGEGGCGGGGGGEGDSDGHSGEFLVELV